MNTIRQTRYDELGYRQDAPGLWRIYHTLKDESPSAVGLHYRTKTELLADLDSYARENWGY